MKNNLLKVQRAKFHTGVQVMHTVVTGLDSIKHKVDMWRLPDGSLFVKTPEPFTTDKVISAGNLVDMDVDKEEM